MRTFKAFCWIFGCLGLICSAIDLADVTVYGRLAGLPQQQVANGVTVIGAILLGFGVLFWLGVKIPEREPTIAEMVTAALDDPRCALCDGTGLMTCFACQGKGRRHRGDDHDLAVCAACRGVGRVPCTSFKHEPASRSALLP